MSVERLGAHDRDHVLGHWRTRCAGQCCFGLSHLQGRPGTWRLGAAKLCRRLLLQHPFHDVDAVSDFGHIWQFCLLFLAQSTDQRLSTRLLINTAAGSFASGGDWFFPSLLDAAKGVNVARMASLARLLQLAGLTVPPLAIIAELNHSISLGQMLGFLVMAICLFSLGHLLQRYAGGR